MEIVGFYKKGDYKKYGGKRYFQGFALASEGQAIGFSIFSTYPSIDEPPRFTAGVYFPLDVRFRELISSNKRQTSSHQVPIQHKITLRGISICPYLDLLARKL